MATATYQMKAQLYRRNEFVKTGGVVPIWTGNLPEFGTIIRGARNGHSVFRV